MNIVENRLDELTSYRSKEEYQTYTSMSDSKDEDSRDQFIKYLQQKGWKLLGEGVNAIVFDHPGLNYIIKIFSNDTAYEKFMRYSQNNPQDPHLPKFKGKWMTVDKKHYLVRMEKLKPIDISSDKMWNIMNEIRIFLQSPRSSEAYFNTVRESNKYLKRNPSLIASLIGIKALGAGRVDIHDENIMLRGKVIVITDPFI